jgi:hypothetical protein
MNFLRGYKQGRETVVGTVGFKGSGCQGDANASSLTKALVVEGFDEAK